MLQKTNVLNRRVAAALANSGESATASPYKGAKVGLFTAISGSVTPFTTMAALTEASFTGYSQRTLTLGTAVNEEDGSATNYSPALEFVASAAPESPVSVRGYFITDGATPPVLLALERWDDAVTIENAGDGFNLSIPVNYGAPSDHEETVVLR